MGRSLFPGRAGGTGCYPAETTDTRRLHTFLSHGARIALGVAPESARAILRRERSRCQSLRSRFLAHCLSSSNRDRASREPPQGRCRSRAFAISGASGSRGGLWFRSAPNNGGALAPSRTQSSGCRCVRDGTDLPALYQRRPNASHSRSGFRRWGPWRRVALERPGVGRC